MAITDNMAFDMLEKEEDAFITGGAISLSEYEHNMSPTDQKAYEQSLVELFQLAYARDPYRRNLSFNHWLKSMKPELYRERAKEWEDIKASKTNLERFGKMDQVRFDLLEDAGMMQRLSHLHTGRIEDLIDIVDATVGQQDSGGQQAMGAPQPGTAVNNQVPE